MTVKLAFGPLIETNIMTLRDGRSAEVVNSVMIADTYNDGFGISSAKIVGPTFGSRRGKVIIIRSATLSDKGQHEFEVKHARNVAKEILRLCDEVMAKKKQGKAGK